MYPTAKKEKTEDKPTNKGKYFYAVSGRKSSKATSRLYPKGKGRITVNEKDYKEYFPYFEFQQIVEAPLKLVGEDGKIDLTIRVKGGGTRGQAEAVRSAIAKSLDKYNNEYHTSLKKDGFLTRDPRKKERKKPGLKGARRAPQWAKR
ncbi:30S ribosomal protein S9 [Patescibacteria group bacterium]|nr:30S ribosomal protein S9 [Patescibacteria group bacterium]MBU4512918.1 30S ribosomal protein S9 [Patescibacteria group bacterium]